MIGYQSSATGRFQVPANMRPAADEAILKAIAEKHGADKLQTLLSADDPDFTRITEPDDFFLGLSTEGVLKNSWILQKGSSIVIGFIDVPFGNYEHDQWLYSAVAPFCTEDSAIYFEGGDGQRWVWKIENQKLVEHDAETLYGPDVNAPDAVRKIVDLLYKNGRPTTADTLLVTHTEEFLGNLLDQIENIVRNAGFGPQAGKTELDRLAEVDE